MSNNSHFPIHSATEMFRPWAGGSEMDLIVARKNRKYDWALKRSLHYTLWWCLWETEITKAAAIYIKSTFHKLKKNICTDFFFSLFWNQAEWKILSPNYTDIIKNMNAFPAVLWYFMSFSTLFSKFLF